MSTFQEKSHHIPNARRSKTHASTRHYQLVRDLQGGVASEAAAPPPKEPGSRRRDVVCQAPGGSPVVAPGTTIPTVAARSPAVSASIATIASTIPTVAGSREAPLLSPHNSRALRPRNSRVASHLWAWRAHPHLRMRRREASVRWRCRRREARRHPRAWCSDGRDEGSRRTHSILRVQVAATPVGRVVVRCWARVAYPRALGTIPEQRDRTPHPRGCGAVCGTADGSSFPGLLMGSTVGRAGHRVRIGANHAVLAHLLGIVLGILDHEAIGVDARLLVLLQLQALSDLPLLRELGLARASATLLDAIVQSEGKEGRTDAGSRGVYGSMSSRGQGIPLVRERLSGRGKDGVVRGRVAARVGPRVSSDVPRSADQGMDSYLVLLMLNHNPQKTLYVYS